jgi:hypothetical protein
MFYLGSFFLKSIAGRLLQNLTLIRPADTVYSEMMIQVGRAFALGLLLGLIAAAQTPFRSFVGTVKSVHADTGDVELQPDKGDPVTARIAENTILQRIAPGEKNLKNAVPIRAADIAAGDRVLVTLEAESGRLRRIVVMPASDIAKRNAADRRDWDLRGISGIVASVSGNQIALKKRSFTGETQETVIVKPTTTFRRYSPDSVRFADAAPSSLGEVKTGDQLRARGEKSADGLTVNADEIVFGTFLTSAGSITAVDAADGEIVIQQLGSNKQLHIRLTADSQLKRMPDFSAFGRGTPNQGGGGPAAAAPRPPFAGPPGSGAGPMGARRGPPDLAQMLEFMPAVKLETLKPGETIVVSSTRGAKADEVTAIMVLANADMLIRMASMSRNAGAAQAGGINMTGGPGSASAIGMTGGLNDLELPGMTF